MFSYIFMKILEGRPRSYDKNMEKASGRRVKWIKRVVADELAGATDVLEIGCGTGELALMLVSQGSVVHGFDMNASMITVADERIQKNHLEDTFKTIHMRIDGMDRFPDDSFDAVVSTLVFSELSDSERRYAFNHSARVLKPDGIMVVADEVIPKSLFKKFIHKLIRLPMIIVTYVVARTVTAPIADLVGEMENVGFTIEREIRLHGESFAIVTGKVLKHA